MNVLIHKLFKGSYGDENIKISAYDYFVFLKKTFFTETVLCRS